MPDKTKTVQPVAQQTPPADGNVVATEQALPPQIQQTQQFAPAPQPIQQISG